jgi:hypothetical protein
VLELVLLKPPVEVGMDFRGYFLLGALLGALTQLILLPRCMRCYPVTILIGAMTAMAGGLTAFAAAGFSELGRTIGYFVATLCAELALGLYALRLQREEHHRR